MGMFGLKPKEIGVMMLAIALATFITSYATTYVSFGDVMIDWLISLVLIAVIVLWLQTRLKKAV
jgi:hypothetical protein